MVTLRRIILAFQSSRIFRLSLVGLSAVAIVSIVTNCGYLKISDDSSTDGQSQRHHHISERQSIRVNHPKNMVKPKLDTDAIGRALRLEDGWIIVEKDFCRQSNSSSLFLLIIVHSDASNQANRKAIRETWGNPNSSTHFADFLIRVKVLFALGTNQNSSLMTNVKHESDFHRDIIQQDFIENYKNLTLKAIMWLKWISLYCPDASYVLKVDDDTFVNLYAVFNLVRTYYDQGVALRKTLTCPVAEGATVYRDPSNKWYVSREEYQDYVYPTYCHGLAYMLSPDLPKLLYQKSMETRFLWVDDVYTTGLLPSKLDKVKFIDVGHLTFEDSNLKRTENYAEEVLFIHLWNQYDKEYFWWKDFNQNLIRFQSPSGNQI